MKHIQTFENFINESSSSEYKTVRVDFEDLKLRDHLADGPDVGEVSEITEMDKDGLTLKRVWASDKSKMVGELFDIEVDHDELKKHPKSFIKVTNFS